MGGEVHLSGGGQAQILQRRERQFTPKKTAPLHAKKKEDHSKPIGNPPIRSEWGFLLLGGLLGKHPT